MRRIYYTLLLLIFCKIIIGQGTDSKVDISSRHSGINIGYGNMHLFKSDIMDYFPSIDASIGNSIRLASVQLKTFFEIDRYFIIDGQFGYSHFIPQTISSTDSLSATRYGHILNLDLGCDLLRKSKTFDLIAGLGLDFGRQRILIKSSNKSIDNSDYTNPFFAPKLFIEPKVIIKFISISFRAEYINDISKPEWKHKNNLLTSIGTTKTTSIIYQIYLGYKF
jgi:hypothetical protein